MDNMDLTKQIVDTEHLAAAFGSLAVVLAEELQGTEGLDKDVKGTVEKILKDKVYFGAQVVDAILPVLNGLAGRQARRPQADTLVGLLVGDPSIHRTDAEAIAAFKRQMEARGAVFGPGFELATRRFNDGAIAVGPKDRIEAIDTMTEEAVAKGKAEIESLLRMLKDADIGFEEELVRDSDDDGGLANTGFIATYVYWKAPSGQKVETYFGLGSRGSDKGLLESVMPGPDGLQGSLTAEEVFTAWTGDGKGKAAKKAAAPVSHFERACAGIDEMALTFVAVLMTIFRLVVDEGIPVEGLLNGLMEDAGPAREAIAHLLGMPSVSTTLDEELEAFYMTGKVKGK